MREARLESETNQFRKENEDLRKYVFQLQGEVYGARLAAKYLDKELAGRYDTLILEFTVPMEMLLKEAATAACLGTFFCDLLLSNDTES